MTIEGYYENGVCVPNETLVLENNRRVIITVLDEPENKPASSDKSAKLAELRSLCHPGKQVWAEDPAVYIRKMRDNDRI